MAPTNPGISLCEIRTGEAVSFKAPSSEGEVSAGRVGRVVFILFLSFVYRDGAMFICVQIGETAPIL